MQQSTSQDEFFLFETTYTVGPMIIPDDEGTKRHNGDKFVLGFLTIPSARPPLICPVIAHYAKALSPLLMLQLGLTWRATISREWR